MKIIRLQKGSAITLVALLLSLSISFIYCHSNDIDHNFNAKAQYDWSGVSKVLNDAIEDKAFPGCVVVVGDKTGALFSKPFGHFTYGIPPPQTPKGNPEMEMDTLFDMASCSKVTGTTTAVAQFYQRGELNLFTKVEDILGREYGNNGKTEVRVINLLLHNAGYPPDPYPDYWAPSFDCPETKKFQPREEFNCQDKIYHSLLNQVLINPVGSTYIYSDLSFITLHYIVGSLAKSLNYVQESDLYPTCDQHGPGNLVCYFEAYLRKHVFAAYSLPHSRYLIPVTSYPFAAPTENDTSYLHRVIQGQVSDGNAYALGGISGHAGLFSNARDMFKFMHQIMFPQKNSDARFILNQTTVSYFIKEYNHSQSSRALGWNTNDGNVNDEGWNQSCGSMMSGKTFMHLGYTGTMLCGDPESGLITVFLTNRVYPTDLNIKIRVVRQLFGNAVVKAYREGRQVNEQVGHKDGDGRGEGERREEMWRATTDL